MHLKPPSDKEALIAPGNPTIFGFQLAQLADAMPQIVWTANPDGEVDYCNRHCIEYTGMSVQQTKGCGWDAVVHPDDLQSRNEGWKKALEMGLPYAVECRLKRGSDNCYRWYLDQALPIKDAFGHIQKWFGTCTDIQDQKETHSSVETLVEKRTVDLMAANSELARELTQRKLSTEKLYRDTLRLNEIITTQSLLAHASLDLESFITLVVNRMDVITPSAGSVVEMLDGDEMVYRAASGLAAKHMGLRLKISGSLSGLCVTTRQILQCDDTESDPRVDSAACKRLGVRSMLVAPLFHEDKAVGVLKIMADHVQAFEERDMQALQLMAGFIGAAIGYQADFEAKNNLLTERSAALKVIQLNERRTRMIIESSHDAFISIDAAGNITDWNSQAEITFGWTKAEAIGQKMAELIIPKRLRAAHLAGMNHFHHTGEGPVLNKRAELQGLRRSGEEISLELTINALKHGETLEFSAFLHDITERKEAEKKLLHMAQFDQLTGLPNRSLFNDRLVNAMQRAKRNKRLMAIMFIDIDHFKHVNDTLGHASGDALLKEFALRLKESVRAVDTVARMGGDEFLVIMEGLNEPSDSAIITDNIMRCVRKDIELNNQTFNVTTSLGGAFYRGQMVTADELIALADGALYKAKEAGRNTSYWAFDTDS